MRLRNHRCPAGTDRLNHVKQCDEYPFGSTKEGARNAKGHFSLRAVATVPNRLHGDAVRNFYADYRVGPDNRFWVQVVP
ncbi:NucA/NucB deoxyribonuclease domain-containing protein [Streptosporangium sp. CA-115845]|uniref:NucA/NucB deoxyribonuclease domain-containing protein n=1 Tax=Streptosporangium sp. CA-115845 TaxID=3240071 RepID=UPI003D8E3F0C